MDKFSIATRGVDLLERVQGPSRYTRHLTLILANPDGLSQVKLRKLSEYYMMDSFITEKKHPNDSDKETAIAQIGAVLSLCIAVIDDAPLDLYELSISEIKRLFNIKGF